MQTIVDANVDTKEFCNLVLQTTHLYYFFAGVDLLRLTREDLIQICGLADGIRLNNALQSK